MTTIVSVRRENEVAMGGDGQVSLGNTVMKGNARKVRRLYNGQVIAGFAGGTADAFTLFERFEAQLEKHQAISPVPLLNWPKTGARTEPCANWKPCWPLRTKPPP